MFAFKVIMFEAALALGFFLILALIERSSLFSFVCDQCCEGDHAKCEGKVWCDCQHKVSR